jgi:hypothetical protein
MIHPTDEIRGHLLLGYEQQLINERITIQQRRARKQAYRHQRRPSWKPIKAIVRLLSHA